MAASPPERARFSSASPYEPVIGFSRAVRAGPRICVSGTAPIGPDGRTVPGGVYAQARRCLELMLEALQALGGEPRHVMRTRIYLVAAEDWQEVGRAHGELFREVQPAATMVVVAGLLDPDWRVETELEAWID